MSIKSSENGGSIFWALNILNFFKKGQIMVPKYQHLVLSEVFPDKFNPDIDFADKAVVPFDVPE